MISLNDLSIIAVLIFLEGVLSIDNALALALLARKLPEKLQRKALTYGLFGAFFFRFVAIGFASYMIHLNWIKFVGGGYLLWLFVSHFFIPKKDTDATTSGDTAAIQRSFWFTVLVIELTDIAFAIDSILAAVALTSKFWLIFTGGMIGVMLMRISATAFIKLLNKFPNFEHTAYILIFLVGLKVILEGLHLPQIDFHSSSSPSFWIFWVSMLIAFLTGFWRKKPDEK